MQFHSEALKFGRQSEQIGGNASGAGYRYRYAELLNLDAQCPGECAYICLCG